jgi:hypothetical protein
VRRDNLSGYTGVSFHHGKRRWIAQRMINGKQTALGSFGTAEAAHEAYQRAYGC